MIDEEAGLTPSERYLGNLARRTFLRLWSFSNLYTDRGLTPGGIGKELCDLLVVCGDHIFVFSDKSIRFNDSKPVEISWRRWERDAILKSAKQVKGAFRWLRDFPNRIFLDAKCTKPLPFPLPDARASNLHGIVVALGAGQACRAYFNEGSGSLLLTTPDAAGDPNSPFHNTPFTITDLNPDGPFIHVFDDTTLDILLRELDTVTDFAWYLDRKSAFLRSGRTVVAHGEEDLLALYLKSMDPETRRHDFVQPDGSPLAENLMVLVEGGLYKNFKEGREYAASKKANKGSYFWDELIERFTANLEKDDLHFRMASPGNQRPGLIATYEQAVRALAMEPRLRRRLLVEAIADGIRKAKPQQRFARVVLPYDERDSDSAFVFFLLPPHTPDGPLSEEDYREVRRNHLYAYALHVALRNPSVSRVIGLATENYAGLKLRGASEDLVVLENSEWTPEERDRAEQVRKELNIFREDMEATLVRSDEFPTLHQRAKVARRDEVPYTYLDPRSVEAGNRQQRRKQKALQRRK